MREVNDQGQLCVHTQHMVANVDQYTIQVSPQCPCRREKKIMVKLKVESVEFSQTTSDTSLISSKRRQIKKVSLLLLVNFAIASPLCHLPC